MRSQHLHESHQNEVAAEDQGGEQQPAIRAHDQQESCRDRHCAMDEEHPPERAERGQTRARAGRREPGATSGLQPSLGHPGLLRAPLSGRGIRPGRSLVVAGTGDNGASLWTAGEAGTPASNARMRRGEHGDA
jgi:hypothetical protein